MQENKSAFNSLLKEKCPSCRKGDIFKTSPLQLNKFFLMHKNCPHCGVKYEIELGFFWAAMYVSYAFAVALVLGTAIVLYNFFGDPDLWIYITVVCVLNFLIWPFSFRYSRVILLYYFSGIKYKPE